jgi:hypothetical protein
MFLQLRGVIFDFAAEKMVFGHIFQEIKPKDGQTGEDPSFEGDPVRQDHVKTGDPVRRNYQELISQIIDIAHFTAPEEPQVLEIRAQKEIFMHRL